MQIARTSDHEAARITSLRDLKELDTPLDERLDRLVRVARRLFDAPTVLVSLITPDHEQNQSCVGVNAAETCRDVSFCAHAILHDEVFIVPDALLDERFCDDPLVVGEAQIRFYAGCPLTLSNGFKLGTLCIFDRVPRRFDDDDLALLRDLAELAEHELTGMQDAMTDPLTGISNREGFTMFGAHTLRVCNRLGRSVSLLSLDVAAADPAANQLFGVPDDEALIRFARILRNTFPDCDVIGRVGDEQFGVLLSEDRDPDLETAICRLQQAVERHNESDGAAPMLAYDAGSAIGDPHYEIGFEHLFSTARRAMRPQIDVYHSTAAP